MAEPYRTRQNTMAATTEEGVRCHLQGWQTKTTNNHACKLYERRRRIRWPSIPTRGALRPQQQQNMPANSTNGGGEFGGPPSPRGEHYDLHQRVFYFQGWENNSMWRILLYFISRRTATEQTRERQRETACKGVMIPCGTGIRDRVTIHTISWPSARTQQTYRRPQPT